ncbi:zinc finger protein 639-like [Contarinia nasturtii]|uniref:zinc finger protein 639-like n=1 Tax=Contarinia nasturtii TaxID=265458 RepID=UPI0012D3E334|nr:zinc finger protein 639-like [Contarinia nasturtii]XP_031620659.1 zinc finger protein 639-like [Contarinia nasturtii]
MDEMYIKKEIKEEIPDEIQPNSQEDIPPETMLLNHLIKLEENDLNYEDLYNQGCSSLNNDYASNEDEEPESVYVDEEPEVFIANFPHDTKEVNDPLASTEQQEEPEQQQEEPGHQEAEVKPKFWSSDVKMRKVRVIRTPPLKNLVKKTYSLQHRMASKSQIRTSGLPGTCNSCRTCKKSFESVTHLRQHELACFKCKHCNLIVISLNYLVHHMAKCRRKIDTSKSVSKGRSNGGLNKKSCHICYAKCTNEEMEEHLKRNHLIPNAYACHLCDCKFDSEFEAHQHLKKAH